MLQYDISNGPKRSGNPSRRMAIAFVLLAVLMIASLVWVARSASHTSVHTLGNPPGMVDRVDFFDTAATWAQGECQRLALLTNAPARLQLHDVAIPATKPAKGWEPKYPREGSWTSPQVQTPYAFTELIPSYNPNCPPGTGLRIDVRTQDDSSDAWSDWFYLGSWGQALAKPQRVIKQPDFGEVDVDTLILYRPASAYQVRLTLYAFVLDENVNPTVRRLAVCYSGVVSDAARREQLIATDSLDENAPARDLPVPFRAQGNAAKPLRPEICSPTSVSMVMQYLGRDRPTEENALGIYDSEYDMFGNWGRAVAWAAENGFDAWLTRFRTFDQVKATIATGQPIIASIRFKKGQCPSFVMSQTAGHLIVIRGVTKDGDYIVNDPASRDRGNGPVYKAADMEKAWFAHGGVGYIIRKHVP